MPEEASLIITNSGIPGAVPEPGFIAFGELTLNWADSALYFKDIDGNIQTISIRGVPPVELDHVPVSEGPWFSFAFPGSPANTAYMPVQKAAGPVPELKIGLIASGENSVEVTLGHHITVSVLAGTTTNQIKGLIESNAEANDLIYFYNSPGSDGTGIVTPPVLASAVFYTVNADLGADRSDILGQVAIVNHTDSTRTEWAVVDLYPTIWMPRTPGIVYNRTDEQWERTYIQDGTIQTEILPDQ